MKQLKLLFSIKIFLLLINLISSNDTEYPNVLLTLEHDKEFLTKAKKETIKEVEDILRNVTIRFEDQVNEIKEILKTDSNTKNLYDKVEQNFKNALEQKLQLMRKEFEPLYKNITANITDPQTKTYAETLASVIRNTSLSINDLEQKIKTIFENIDWKSSDQLKPLIPKELNLQINFKPKPWTSRFIDGLKNFGKKVKGFFTGDHKNETTTQEQEIVKVSNDNPNDKKQ
uniref:SXP/RAL-2 family protein Ani s 5-like cation-binding domain-containing protein n=1 Tax=Strongyloides venezuelensis TaxID=75913 RepID=A0A0K0EWI8_STRVS